MMMYRMYLFRITFSFKLSDALAVSRIFCTQCLKIKKKSHFQTLRAKQAEVIFKIFEFLRQKFITNYFET